MCNVCDELRAGEALLEHWRDTDCKDAENRLLQVAIISLSDIKEKGAEAPLNNNG